MSIFLRAPIALMQHKECPYTRRCALRCTVPHKKEKTYDLTTTVSFRGDLRADAIG